MYHEVNESVNVGLLYDQNLHEGEAFLITHTSDVVLQEGEGMT